MPPPSRAPQARGESSRVSASRPCRPKAGKGLLNKKLEIMDCFSIFNMRPIGERYMQKKDERKKLNEKLEIMDSFSLLNKMTVGERCMQKMKEKS